MDYSPVLGADESKDLLLSIGRAAQRLKLPSTRDLLAAGIKQAWKLEDNGLD